MPRHFRLISDNHVPTFNRHGRRAREKREDSVERDATLTLRKAAATQDYRILKLASFELLPRSQLTRLPLFQSVTSLVRPICNFGVSHGLSSNVQ